MNVFLPVDLLKINNGNLLRKESEMGLHFLQTATSIRGSCVPTEPSTRLAASC